MPKKVDHQVRRIEILKGCFQLFASSGYNKLSMRDLARSLEVTTGTLYHYFTSKQQIFEELFDLLQSLDIVMVTSQFSNETPQRQRFEILNAFLVKEAPRLSAVLKISLEYQRVHSTLEADDRMKQNVQRYVDALVANLQIDQAVAETLLSLIFGILVQVIFTDEVDVKGQLSQAMNLVVLRD